MLEKYISYDSWKTSEIWMKVMIRKKIYSNENEEKINSISMNIYNLKS